MFVGYPRGIAVGRGYLGPRDVTRKGAAGQRDAFFRAAAAVRRSARRRRMRRAQSVVLDRWRPQGPVKGLSRESEGPQAALEGSTARAVALRLAFASGLKMLTEQTNTKRSRGAICARVFAHEGERRIARSPDERQRNPGPAFKLRKPLPDFTEPVIGPATSGRTRWFHPGHERKGGGTPADAYLQPPHP